MKNEKLHNHPQLEKKLGLDQEHVIIDKKKFEELFLLEKELKRLNEEFSIDGYDISFLERINYSFKIIKRVRKFLKTDFTVKERNKMSKLLKKFLKYGYVDGLIEDDNKCKNSEIEKKELLMLKKDNGNEFDFIKLLFGNYCYPIDNWEKKFVKNNEFMSLEEFRIFMLEFFNFVSDYAKETDYSFFPENFFSAMSNSFFNFSEDENCECNDGNCDCHNSEDLNVKMINQKDDNIYYDGVEEENENNNVHNLSNDIETINEC